MTGAGVDGGVYSGGVYSGAVAGVPREDWPERVQQVDWVQALAVYEIAMPTRFRGLTARRGMVLQSAQHGWVEWSPFEEYGVPEASRWWLAAEDAAVHGFPVPVRDVVPVNVTVPAEPAGAAHARVAASGCGTAKVKVAEPSQTSADDIARVEAVRDALGPGGRLRIDANGAWAPGQALTMINELRRFDLEYVEQPCAGVEDLARLRHEVARRGWHVPIAADESIRRAGDPERVASLGAADVAVIKVQPLGGVKACLELGERLGMPLVVSSALETSVGLRAGVALAAALPELPFACGLNTSALLAGDLTTESLRARDGQIAVGDGEVDAAALAQHGADERVTQRWLERLDGVLAHLQPGRPA
ncbi:o-succinylbenzoate synthase [Propionibacteriaceae bacterium G1746]|uniref:o-succinylbenzoate synthase n=1 Tax=Aestuariimicrobium sp. G57 TaxID=3418485 RepID=UPI003C20FED5